MSSSVAACVSLLSSIHRFLVFSLTRDGSQTAGLTIAARLTEDPHVSVAVLEAGLANLDDPNILIPTQFGKTFGNPKVPIPASDDSG